MPLLLVCVGRGWAGRGRNDICRKETGLGLGEEDKTNGEQEINWLAEIRPKKSETEKKDELGMEKTMETKKLKRYR